MKKITQIAFAFILTSLPMTCQAGVWDNLWGSKNKSCPTIDVLVLNDQQGAMLEAVGKYKLFDPNTGNHLGTRVVGKRKMIQSIPTGLKWGEEFPGIYQMHVVPMEADSKVILDGVEYYGSLFIYDVGGSISVVNRLMIEDYLKSTLNSQFTTPIPEETLAAVAIVARTNALYESRNPKNQFWAVDGAQVGYHGVPTTIKSNALLTAIDQTRNMVLSETGAYEGVVTPIPSQWGSGTGGNLAHHSKVFSHISLFEAEKMGQSGKDAAEILGNAFPEAHIELLN